jgi:hypothetical protein
VNVFLSTLRAASLKALEKEEDPLAEAIPIPHAGSHLPKALISAKVVLTASVTTSLRSIRLWIMVSSRNGLGLYMPMVEVTWILI